MKLAACLFIAAALCLAAASSPVDAANTRAVHGHTAGRRLGWGLCWSFWNCPKPKPGPKCAPCSTPCPSGFKYVEKCAYWWWESDVTSCVPETAPAKAVPANSDVTQRGDCSYWFFANGEGKFGSAPASCPAGYTDRGITKSKDNCCQPPIWARGGRALRAEGRELLLASFPCSDPKTKPYGYFQTRRCVKDVPVKVFKINEPETGCPTWAMMDWQTTFDTCKFCANGRPSSDGCWLPYSKNSDGQCFAYDAGKIGWWKPVAPRPRPPYLDSAFDSQKGGAEALLAPKNV